MERLDERVFAAKTETIHAARQFVRNLGEAIEIQPPTLDDIELATSELVSNAIEHGSGDDYQIRLATSSNRFVIEVISTHNGTTLGTPTEWTTSDPELPTGRGLGLVSAVSADVWVQHTGDRMIIGCEFIS